MRPLLTLLLLLLLLPPPPPNKQIYRFPITCSRIFPIVFPLFESIHD